MQFQKERVEKEEITGATLKNFIKSIKIFCDSADIDIPWKKVTRGLPKGRQAANDGGISKPFRSRFMEFSLTPYSYDEFCEIAVNLLEKRYRHPEELSLKVAYIVWNKLESKDVRDILTIGKLSNSVNDVDFIATTLQKYKRRNEV